MTDADGRQTVRRPHPAVRETNKRQTAFCASTEDKPRQSPMAGIAQEYAETAHVVGYAPGLGSQITHSN